MKLESCCTMLFTPANKPERFQKAWDINADALIIDLEDAISISDKDSAREQAISFLREADFPQGKTIIAVRINSIQTAAGLKDITTFIESGICPDVFLFPKVEYAAEIVLYDKHFSGEQYANVEYCALIETAIGLQNAHKIAGASRRLKSLAFGGGDLATDLNAQLEFEPMLYARSRIVQAAKTHQLSALDVPHLDFRDNAGNRKEAELVKAMGYSGKFAIHPCQLEVLREVFLPSTEEIEIAQTIVNTYKNAKGNAVQYQGKMIDVPIYHSALRTLQVADRCK
ncbi:HpcH/HpaI aldolase/citrate lyase family protein [Cysteiniphilum halobium]|uniref:HpcH/HpaI aldolase/citrate lyase family protein n=1 Tax=Cysteiniphilum halobium TaxID=2219059 RepID=UPI003F843BAD